MSVALRYDLISAVVQAGARVAPGELVDPSTSDQIKEAGVSMVTPYIEQLALLGIVERATPLFGSDGGMWIGYVLTEAGRELAMSEPALRRVVGPLIGGPRTEVSEAVADLHEECMSASLSDLYRDDFLQTLHEIRICFDEECFIAAIALAGKILEVTMKEVLRKNGITVDPNAMLGPLLRTVRERLPGEYLDPALSHVANMINVSRNTAIHANERIPVPSRDQAAMVLFAMRDAVRRKLLPTG